MARTDATLVQSALGFNYASRSAPSLARYIAAGNILVNNLVTRAAQLSITIDDATLAEIETWVSAWFYTKMDPLYKQKSMDRAGGAFARGPDDYKEAAVALDPTGLLDDLMKGDRKRAGGTWLGKTDAESLSYEERN